MENESTRKQQSSIVKTWKIKCKVILTFQNFEICFAGFYIDKSRSNDEAVRPNWAVRSQPQEGSEKEAVRPNCVVKTQPKLGSEDPELPKAPG